MYPHARATRARFSEQTPPNALSCSPARLHAEAVILMKREASTDQGERQYADDLDQALVNRVRQGDSLAFEQLIRDHYAAMCACAAGLLRSRDAVEDIAQNVFRRLWASRERWQPKGSVRAYLLRAAHRETLSVIRSIRREKGLVGRIAQQTVLDRAVSEVPGMGRAAAAADDVVVRSELRAAIEAAATDLPPRCRHIFRMRWASGLAPVEIAAELGISIKTVEMQITRAYRAIRSRLAALGLP